MVDHQRKSLSFCVQTISEAPTTAVEKDLSVDDELIELIKMLARAAAREDYHKAKSADTITFIEAG